MKIKIIALLLLQEMPLLATKTIQQLFQAKKTLIKVPLRENTAKIYTNLFFAYFSDTLLP